MLLNYLPVGSEEATEFYMECALEAGVGVVNCMPVFIASDAKWAGRFERARLPIIGEDLRWNAFGHGPIPNRARWRDPVLVV